MQIDKECMLELAELISKAVVTALKNENIVGIANANASGKKQEKTAYQKTEQLLFAYNGFKRIIKEKQLEIENLRKYGVPQKSGSIVAYTPHSANVQGTVLQEESVEIAVRNVEASVQGTVDAVALIDKCMAALSTDPYYKILEMRYFEGRTLEDIGVYYSCDHSTISRNKTRLVRELALHIFPNDVVNEYLR